MGFQQAWFSATPFVDIPQSLVSDYRSLQAYFRRSSCTAVEALRKDVDGESFSATTKRAEVRIGKVSVYENLIENLESQPV